MRSRLRPLDERECYLRLHGRRSGEIEIVPRPAEPAGGAAQVPAPRAVGPAEQAPVAPRRGPTDETPALHLVIAYPRRGARLTGEQVRRELLRRMQERTGEAA